MSDDAGMMRTSGTHARVAGDRVIGRASIPVRLLSSALVAVAVVLLVLTSSDRSNPYSTVLLNDAFFGILGTIGFLLSTTCILVRDGSIVVVRNLFFARRFTLDMVQGVKVDNGLEIELQDGARVRSTAFGRSASGRAVGYPRSRIVRDALEALLVVTPGRQTEDVPRVSLRMGSGVGIGLTVLMFLAVGLFIRGA